MFIDFFELADVPNTVLNKNRKMKPIKIIFAKTILVFVTALSVAGCQKHIKCYFLSENTLVQNGIKR